MRHTCITFIAKTKTESKERIKSYNQIKMCMYRDMMDMVRWILVTPFCMLLSLYFDSFVDMAIFFYFFLGPSCVQLFFFFSLGPSCVHIFSIVFVISTWRERERSTDSVELYFVE
jgi:hypothetical protein